jgi:hypothetical protein
MQTRNKKIEKLAKMEWEHCSTSALEDFFSLLDDNINQIEESVSVVRDAGRSALYALKRYEDRSSSIVLTFAQRAAAVCLGVINAICVWGELCLMFKKEFSIFYILSHIKMPQLVSMGLVSTPILAYLMFIGSWSLTHLRLGSFFRFTKGATNANTLSYFAIILCRLGPTIAFHYLQQIAAEGSETQKVMGVMDVIVFIGTHWNIYSPILLVLVMLFFAFSVPDRIAECLCGKDTFWFDDTRMNYESLVTGEDVLKELEMEACGIIERGSGLMSIYKKEEFDVRRDHDELKDRLREASSVAP